MRICIVIPAHNEAQYICDCLYSFVHQTWPPDEVIVVDDNSSDDTYELVKGFSKDHPWIRIVRHQSAKVIQAFNFGMKQCTIDYDLIGKFDADIVLPHNYFEQMRNHFQANWLLGMCSGLLYTNHNKVWSYEKIANKSHVRGPIKLYYREVFELMGGLREGVGWDTVDVLLCQYHEFEVMTDETLMVKHLRPTGHGYSKKNYRKKGEALYKMRYGLPLSKLALFKMAVHTKSIPLYLEGIFGYVKAWLSSQGRFVTPEEGKFIRKLRWKGIVNKLSSKY